MKMKDLITQRGGSFRVRRMVDGVRTSHYFKSYEEARLFSLKEIEEELSAQLGDVRTEIKSLKRKLRESC